MVFKSLEISRQAFRRHVELHSLHHYTGVLSMQGMAHWAVDTSEPAIVALCREHLLPLVRGEVSYRCNFPNYLCGGNGTALLCWKGHLPEAREAVRHHAELLLQDAVRDRDGIFSNPLAPVPGKNWNREQIWIDVAFAVTPFLTYAGRLFDEDAYMEEAFQQIAKMTAVLADAETGLLHQCRGFSEADLVTADHWSRGNGWAMNAWAELIDGLPDDDRRRPEAERQFRELAEACLRYQNSAGLWHHEMPDPASFVETSGSGLILHGLIVGVARGVLPASVRSAIERGLKGYLSYIDPDGSVRNACRGCRSPKDGSIEAYLKMYPIENDYHAFGPVILAFSAAATRLGLNQIQLS